MVLRINTLVIAYLSGNKNEHTGIKFGTVFWLLSIKKTAFEFIDAFFLLKTQFAQPRTYLL